MFEWIQGPVMGIISTVAGVIAAGVPAVAKRFDFSTRTTVSLAAVASVVGTAGLTVVCVDTFGAPATPSLYVVAGGYCVVVFLAALGIDLGVGQIQKAAARRRAEKHAER